MNNRRKLVIALGAGVFAAPFASFAQQQGKVWRIGFLSSRDVKFVDSDYYYGPLRQGLRELGYVDGQNLRFEWRSADGIYERLPELAAELVRLKVDILVTAATPATRAAQKATTRIPIVMVGVGDPVGYGLIKSLARPGSNSTGLSSIVSDLGPKLLEILRGVAPNIKRVTVLANSRTAGFSSYRKNIQEAGGKLGVEIRIEEASSPKEIENAFRVMSRLNANALIVTVDPFFVQQRHQIAELAAKQKMVTVGGHGEFAEAGGLMSYGASQTEMFRRAAVYVDKIIRGANPGDLPVEQPSKFEFVINLNTAKALGIKIPQSILVQATKVIE